MLWKGREQSENIEDRRGMGGRKMAAGGGAGLLVVVALVWLLGGNPSEVLNTLQSTGSQGGAPDARVVQAEQELAQFAAGAVGDDRIQMKSQGYVVPDAFTHGTSEQRKGWFLKGFKTGDLNQGKIDL
jgi:predicted metalloprotease